MEATEGTGTDKQQTPLLELWHKGPGAPQGEFHIGSEGRRLEETQSCPPNPRIWA